MQIICKDGTTIQCQDFEAIGSGVLFFQESSTRRTELGEEEHEEDEAEESAEMEEDPRADGFVPITELHFVLPDEMVQQPPTGRASAQEQGRTTHQPPTQQGGMAQQQQMQQFPGGPNQPPR